MQGIISDNIEVRSLVGWQGEARAVGNVRTSYGLVGLLDVDEGHNFRLYLMRTYLTCTGVAL
jgi:hypothetical protein